MITVYFLEICTSCKKNLSVDVTDDYKTAVIQDIGMFQFKKYIYDNVICLNKRCGIFQK